MNRKKQCKPQTDARWTCELLLAERACVDYEESFRTAPYTLRNYPDIRGSKESEFLLVMSQKVLVICEPKHSETMQNKARVRRIKPVQ